MVARRQRAVLRHWGCRCCRGFSTGWVLRCAPQAVGAGELSLQPQVPLLRRLAGWQAVPDDPARRGFGAAPAQRDSQLVRRTRSARRAGERIISIVEDTENEKTA